MTRCQYAAQVVTTRSEAMSHVARRLSALLILAALGASGCHRHVREQRVLDPASRRVTASGTVAGFVGRYGSHAWLGIPFAKPPIGLGNCVHAEPKSSASRVPVQGSAGCGARHRSVSIGGLANGMPSHA